MFLKGLSSSEASCDVSEVTVQLGLLFNSGRAFEMCNGAARPDAGESKGLTSLILLQSASCQTLVLLFVEPEDGTLFQTVTNTSPPSGENV